ncbi:MAG: GNAT family N-acetyltransferase [Pyrinomonadaceae bacterium]|nr:GNAT family N-acetyltransferase [Pyrinomonadaceae bacterium]
MPIRKVCLETFVPEIHFQRLRGWLFRPDVARWWGNPQIALEHLKRCSPDQHAVILADGDPVGYLCWQSPSRNELEDAGLADLPEDIVDIDILIGEPEFRNRGVGPRSLELLLNRLKADPLVSIAGVGTAVSNKRAIRAFEKAGFRVFREFKDPAFGSSCYMVVRVRNAA